ncbi:winged helix-turn-helix domain-containing protein [Paenibacillus sp. J5C_2022]|uniref:BTAD domain-containing putative transcriptional regulator n=1 Tax=Paenibacillus sp. J5C2022 TaxID=2977129 RepID=UPI0021D14CFE|nr:BTAD domain-containing putative transcriptional regulator [Paenibacillus sp. J5C2022]MCU6711945.1 winged helix-turn-helix domain-containing protein [Paenibacillus sp. J5C2022]
MIVKTKLTIPPVSNDLVDRSSLMRLLHKGMGTKLTLLSAPAGYGKTTALSKWTRLNNIRAAWLSLDQHDNDWVQFWSCVTASIQDIIPDYGQTVWPLLENGPSASRVSAEPAVQAMLNELNLFTCELAIILDDVHLIEHPAIHQSLSYLLERLPSSIHLYMASRTELPFPTARLLAKGDMQRITMQDLRFTHEEGVAYFRGTTELSLTREQVVKLCQQTEGWISGLKLAAIALARSDNIAESIRAFSGHQHHISEYLLEEVFHHQSEEMRAFLLRTSILSRMNDSLCRAVTGLESSQNLFETLKQGNLFTIPLDDQHNWYRYHHLLSDFLQKLFSRTAEGEWTKAHVQAANWLESHGFVEEAAEHYLAGRQYEDVVRIMEEHLLAFLFKKSIVLGELILQVPESYLVNRPYLEWFYLNLMFVDRTRWAYIPEKVEQARTRYEALKDQMSEENWNKMMGDFYLLSAMSCFIQKDLTRSADYLIMAEHYLTEDSLTYLIGQNKYFGTEELEDHLFYINDHHEAAAYLHRMIDHCGPRTDHPYIASMFASYSKLLYDWNRLEEAEACLNRMMKPNHKPLIPRMLFHVHITAARIQLGLGNRARAQELMEQLKLTIDSPDYELFMRKIEAEEAWQFVRQDDIAFGVKWLEYCGMASTDEVSLVSVSEHMALSYVLSACGRTEEAWSLSEKLIQLLVKEDRLRDRIKMIILQGLLLYRMGQKKEALNRLETALHLAQPEGLIRSFIDEGAVMAELLSEYVQADRDLSIKDYAKSLLQAFQDSQPIPPKMIRAQVCCFGRFQVTSGQGDGNAIKWRTSKTEELMAYLVHHRGEPVDRDLILNNLWGDMDSDRARVQLNNTVYTLRKNLSTLGLEGIVQHVKGYYRIEMHTLNCDYIAFLQLISEGVPAPIEHIKEYEEILGKIYRNGYLQGNDFPWAEGMRSRLENEYFRILLQISEHYVQEREFSFAVNQLNEILAFNPLNEEIHAKLIRVYMLAGDRVSAMKQYDSLKGMLQAELGVEPKESIRQLL